MAGEQRARVHRGRETDEGLSRIAQDHDKGVELSLSAVDCLAPELLPVDLGLEPRLGLESPNRRALDPPADQSDIVLHDRDFAVVPELYQAFIDQFAVVRGVLF